MKLITEIDEKMQRSYAKWKREEDERWEQQKAWARRYTEARAAYEAKQREQRKDIQ